MGNKNEMRQIILETLQNMREHSVKLSEAREKKRWKIMTKPFGFSDTLSNLTKDQLFEISRLHNFNNRSSLNKQGLIASLEELLPSGIVKLMLNFDYARFEIIKRLIANKGIINKDDLDDDVCDYLFKYGISYPVIYEEKHCLYTPSAILDALKTNINMVKETKLTRNTEFIKLTHGMIHYYGYLDRYDTNDRLEFYYGKDFNYAEYWSVIFDSLEFYTTKISYFNNALMNNNLNDELKIIEERKLRSNLDFYPFTKEELLRASADNYYEKTPEMELCLKHITKISKLTKDYLEILPVEIVEMINNDVMLNHIIEYLNLSIPNFNYAQELVKLLQDVHNSTRQWLLKGYKPNDLAPSINKSPIENKSKVGRNDLCPCDSGIKYKRCCLNKRV